MLPVLLAVRRSRTLRLIVGGAAVLVGWTLFGALASADVFLSHSLNGAGDSFRSIALHVSVFYWVWAALTPVLLRTVRAAARSGAARRAGLLAAGAVGALALHGAAYLGVIRLADATARREPLRAAALSYVLRHGGGDLATYGVLVGVYFLYRATRHARARELAAAELRARLVGADLEILRWQLQPHFLFNALNTVSTLVLRNDADAAEQALARIARYLRATLTHRADVLVPLAEELRLVESYVEIEALRFGATLRVDRAVSGRALGCRVPSLIVQPLVENAIRHGLGRSDGAGPVRIAAHIDQDRLVLTVSDGHHAPHATDARDATEVPNGFGLRYVRERLGHFYGDAAHLRIAVSATGATSTIVMPYASATGAPALAAPPAPRARTKASR